MAGKYIKGKYVRREYLTEEERQRLRERDLKWLNLRKDTKEYKEHKKNQYYKNRDKRLKIAKISKLKIQYGLTLEECQSLFKSQEGKCAICKEFENGLVIDHNHFTGKVRGLLCNKCNLGLGLFRDNPEFLSVAKEYVS